MKSVWIDSCEMPSFDKLNKDIRADVVVIGGGIAGLLCAYMLKNEGVECVLLEADTICSGITKNTTAKITSQHALIYHKLIKEFGTEKAKMYLDANQAALSEYRKLCKNISCDFENKDAFTYSVNDRKKLEDEVTALQKLGFRADIDEYSPLPITTVGAVRFRNQAQFNPLKFLSVIAGGLNIYEHSKVTNVKPNFVKTNEGSVTFKKMIVATHFPFINKHGSYPLKMYQHRSYVIALENADNVDGMYIDDAQGGFSFRNYKNLLLLGGGSHRTGKLGGSYDELRDFASHYYENAKEKYYFATQDCMTLDGVPYIGQYAKTTPDLYVVTGFNKWGMTSSMVSAMILRDMICGKDNEYKEIFSPSRTMLRPQLAVNSVEAVANLLSVSPKRCPHLGCALKWNPYEHTWDCPCHGSRFTKDGKLIDNPATDSLQK